MVSSQRIELAGIGPIHYLAAGHGPPVVMLHGLAASVVAWRFNVAALSERYSVFVPDLPGHGDSAKPAVRYDTEFGLRFLEGFLAALSLEWPVIVGNSTGGFLALAWALKHPGQVRALVLVDIPGIGREVSWPLRLASLPGIGPPLASLDFATGGRFAPRLFQHPELVDDQTRSDILSALKDSEAVGAVFSALRSGVGLTGLRSSQVLVHHGSASLSVPTLVVWGQKDRIVPVEHAHRFARQFPDVQLFIVPDCGHWPQMEQANSFNKVVLAFLDRVVAAKEG